MSSKYKRANSRAAKEDDSRKRAVPIPIRKAKNRFEFSVIISQIQQSLLLSAHEPAKMCHHTFLVR